MSQARTSKLWKLTDSIRNLLRGGEKAKRKARKIEMRHLQMDPLEERTLLSLTIGSTDDVLVNTEWQDIRGDVSVAINSSNDVVAAWTAADQLTDPMTGEVIGEDLNIYARYLTDEVQIVTIPVETALIGNGTSFKLLYGSAAVQRLSFFTATVPNSYDSTSTMEGSVTLTVNNLSIDFFFSESLTPLENAANLQTAIRSLGADYSEVEVVAYTERDFDITWYGSAFTGEVPDFAVSAQDFPYDEEYPNVNFVAGAIVETISAPTEITAYSLYSGKDIGIAVTGNAQTMAASIENAFNADLSDSYYAPVQRNWYYDETTKVYTYTTNLDTPFRADTRYAYATTRTMPQIEVDVQALETVTQNVTVNLYDAAGNYVGQETKNITYFQFQISFTGNSGYENHQELQLSSVKLQGTEKVNDLSYAAGINAFSAEGYVETIKESSSVFRVNDPEQVVYATDINGNVMLDPDGYEIIVSDGKTDQYIPEVALDDSGNFIVVWESVADDSLNGYDKTDIYARRFSIQGVVDTDVTGHLSLTFYADGGQSDVAEADYIPLAYSDPYLADIGTVELVQGVRPLADQFRVNVETNGTQEKPSLSVDSTGNFVVSWTTDSQWNDYYAGILARWFDKTGLAITDDVAVNTEVLGTPSYGESYVKMGPDGTTVVVWLENENLYKSVYAPGQTTPFVDSVLVAEQAYGPSIDFDANGRYVLAWTAANSSFLVLSNSDSFSTVYAELFYITSTEDEVYSETSLGSGPVSEVETGWSGNAVQASQAEQYLLCVGNVSVGMDADGDIFFAYNGYGFDTQEANTDVYKLEDDGSYTNISNTYTGAIGSDIFLSLEDIESVLEKTGNLDLLPYFEGWFSDSTISTYSQSSYADIIYVVDNGVTSVRYMVDVDSYIAACLSSVQRQIQDDLYEEYYEDYFKELEDYVNERYEVRRQEEDRIRGEIEDVIVNWYHDFLYDKTLEDYAGDSTSIVTDIASRWYGMTFADVVASLMDVNGEAYLNMFEKVLREHLFDYYFEDRYGMTYEIWYQTLVHEYAGDELEAMIAEKVGEIDEMVDHDIELWLARMASTGMTPLATLQTLVDDGELPPVDAVAVADQTVVELREWVRQYMIEIEINEVLFRASDAIYMRTLGYTAGWYSEIDSWVQGRSVWGPEIDGLIYNEETEEYEIGPEGIMGIDDLVKDDLTSTYKERYDKIVAEKVAEVTEKLEAVRTYDFYANSDNTVIYQDSDYAGDIYSDICAKFTGEERDKILVPGDAEYDEHLLLVEAQVREEYDWQAIYEGYRISLQPLYTVNGVVNKTLLDQAATEAANEELQEIIDSRMAAWVLEQYVLDFLKAETEAEYGEAILEFLRTLPDTDETLTTAQTATEAQYFELLSMNPAEALRLIQSEMITDTAPFYTLRSLYKWYLLNNEETRDIYVDSDGYINEIRLDRAVQLTPVLRIINELSDAWIEELARDRIDETLLAAIRTQVREEYYGTKDTLGNITYSGILYDAFTYQYGRLSYDCLTNDQLNEMANIFAEYLTAHPNGQILDADGDVDPTKLFAYIDEMFETPIATTEKLRALYTNYLENHPNDAILDADGNVDAAKLEAQVNALLPLPTAAVEELRADYEIYLRLYPTADLIDEYGNMDETKLQEKIERDLPDGTESVAVLRTDYEAYLALYPDELCDAYATATEQAAAFLPAETASTTTIKSAYEQYLRKYPPETILYPDGSINEIALNRKLTLTDTADMVTDMRTHVLADLYEEVTDTMNATVVDLLVDQEMDDAVEAEVALSWSEVEGERYEDVLYNYYKPIVTHAMFDDLVASYTVEDWENLRALYADTLLEQDLAKPEILREFVYYLDELNPVTGETERMIYVNEDALNRATSAAAFDSVDAWHYALLLNASPEVEARTADKVEAAIDAVSDKILDWRENGDSVSASYYETLTEWVVEEQVRQRMIEEVEVDDELCREFYAEDLEKALTELHEELVDTDARRTALFEQYYEYVRSNTETAWNKTYLADVKSLLTDLTYLPEYYTEYYSAKKDVELESLYSELIAPMFTDSVGNVDDDAIAEAVAQVDRDQIIAALVYDQMCSDTGYYVEEWLAETFQFEQKEYGDYTYNGKNDYSYEELVKALSDHCVESYRALYDGMTDEALRALYRKLMVSQYSDATELNNLVNNATHNEMVEALTNAAIEAEYRKIIEPDYTNEAGVVNLLDIQWAIENVTFDEMAEAIAEAQADLMTQNIVQSKIDTVVSVLVYQAILQETPVGQRAETGELYTAAIRNAAVNSAILAADAEIRQAHELEYYNELRGQVETEYTEIFTKELLPSYTSETGEIDWWSLELAIQDRIDAQTQIEVDAKIRAEAAALVDQATADGVIDALVAERTASTLTLIDLSDSTGATYDTLKINYSDIKCTAQPIAATVTNDAMALNAWQFVEDEIARLVEIRVNYDLYVWNELETQTEKADFVNGKLNTFLEVPNADAYLQTEASDRLTDLYDYKDNATHLETQESIIYDEVYSALYQENAESLYAALGAETTYCNLINDTESVFVANEFSPFYGMTYAEICAYLTSSLAADANMATSTAIAAAFEVYFEPLVRESQYIADFKEQWTNIYQAKYDTIFAAKLAELEATISEELYAQYEAQVRAAMEQYDENHASEKRQYLIDPDLPEDFYALLDKAGYSAAEVSEINILLISYSELEANLFMADCLASESFADGINGKIAAYYSTGAVSLRTSYEALLNAAGYTTSDLNAALAEIDEMIADGGNALTEAKYIMAEALAFEQQYKGFNAKEYLISREPLVQLMAEYEDLLTDAGYDAETVSVLMNIINDAVAANKEAVARRLMASELAQSSYMSRTRNLVAEEAELAESYQTGLEPIIEAIYQAQKSDPSTTTERDTIVEAAKAAYPKLADAIDAVNAAMSDEEYDALVASTQTDVTDELAADFTAAMIDVIGYDQAMAQSLFESTGLTADRCQIDLQVIVSSLVNKAESLREAGYTNDQIKTELVSEWNALRADVLVLNSDIADSLTVIYNALAATGNQEALINLAVENVRTAYDKAQMDLWDLYRPIIEAATTTPATAPEGHDYYVRTRLDAEVASHLDEKLAAVEASLVASLAQNEAEEMAHVGFVADVERAITQTLESFFEETYRTEMSEQNLSTYETLLIEMGDAFAEKADEYAEWVASYSGSELVDTLTFEEYYPGFVQTKFEFYNANIDVLKAEYSAMLENGGFIDSDIDARFTAINELIAAGNEAQARNIMADALAKEHFVSDYTATEYSEYANNLKKRYLELLGANGYTAAQVAQAQAAVEELTDWCYGAGFQEYKTLCYQFMADALANEQIYAGFTENKLSYLNMEYSALLTEYEQRLSDAGYSTTDLTSALNTITSLAESSALANGQYDACVLMANALTLDDMAVNNYVDSDGAAQVQSYLEGRYVNQNDLTLAYKDMLTNAGWTDTEIDAQILALGSMTNQEEADEIMADALALESFNFGTNGLIYTYSGYPVEDLRTLYSELLVKAGYSEDDQTAELARIDAMSDTDASETMAGALAKNSAAKTYMATYYGYSQKSFAELYSEYELALDAAGYLSYDKASALSVISGLSTDDATTWMADHLALFSVFSTPRYTKGYSSVSYEFLQSNRNDLMSRYMTILSNAGYSVSERQAAKNAIEGLINAGNEALALQIMSDAVTANDCDANFTARSCDYFSSDFNSLRSEYQALLQKSGYFTDDLNAAMDEIDLLVRSGKKDEAYQLMANALSEEYYNDGFGATYYDNARTDEQTLIDAYVEKELWKNWDAIVATLSDEARKLADRFTVDDKAELIESVVEGRQAIYDEMVAALEAEWRPILREQICDGLLEGPLDDRLAEKIAELTATDEFKAEFQSRFHELLKGTEILVELINADSVEYGKQQLQNWVYETTGVSETFDETVSRFASEPFDMPITLTAEAMTELALRAKAKLLTDEEINSLINEKVEEKIAATVKELVDEKMAEYNALITQYYSKDTDAERAAVQAQIDELLAPVAEYLQNVYGGITQLVADSVPAQRETVKEYMLEHIIVPNAVHSSEYIYVDSASKDMTMEELEKMASLVCYAEIYRDVYDAKRDTIIEELTLEVYANLSAEERAQLEAKYADTAFNNVYNLVYSDYHDIVQEQVETDEAETIEALRAAADDPVKWWAVRNSLDRNQVYQEFRDDLEQEWIDTGMPGILGLTVGSAEWEAAIDQAVDDSLATKGSVTEEDVSEHACWTQYWSRSMGLYAYGSVGRGLEILYCEEADTKASQQADEYIESRVTEILAEAINTVNSGGTAPTWVTEDNPIPLVSDELEVLIRVDVQERSTAWATAMVAQSDELLELVDAAYAEKIEDIKIEMMSADPKYQILESYRLGRANAVLEYVLSGFRGSANDILYTSYNASGTTSTGDARGVVNAQRDGNNTKYYLAVPQVNISSGTLDFEVGTSGSRVEDGVENNYFEYTTISVSLSVTDSELNLAETALAITNAFIGSSLNIDAGWFDGLSVRVIDDMSRNVASLYDGTYWEWSDSILSKINDSEYWPEQYVVYELTFQGGAHDSEVDLKLSNTSTLVFDAGESFTNLVSEISGDDGLSQAVYQALAEVYDSSSPTIDFRSFAQQSAVQGAETLSAFLNEMIVADGDDEETRTIKNNLNSAMSSILTRAIKTRGLNTCKDSLQTLLDNKTINALDTPVTYSIVTYLLNNSSDSDSLTAENPSVFVAAFNLFALNGYVYQLDYDRDATEQNAGTFRKLPYTDTDQDAEVITFVDENGNVHERTLQARSALSFETRLEDLVTAMEAVGDTVSDEDLYEEYVLQQVYNGYRGTVQENPSVGMTDSGNIVVAWQQQSRYSGSNASYIPVENTDLELSQSTQIYLRTMVETTDYAGARATSVSLPDGNKIEDGETITTATKNLVVSFTENLRTVAAGYSALHAVDNVDNWSLICDGVVVENAIENITFQMSASRSYAANSSDIRINGTDGNPESLAYGSNLWEAVITFKDGYELTGGNYTLIASNKIQDIAGNAINSNGYGYTTTSRGNRDGSDFEISFNVLAYNKPLAFGQYTTEEFNEKFGAYYSAEENIQDQNIGDNRSQYTTEDLLEETTGYNANTPDTVASDANGNFVAVWTEAEKDENGVIVSGGIYYKVYRQEYIYNADGERILKTIELSSGTAVTFTYKAAEGKYYYDYSTEGIDASKFEVPQQASVAMDDTGRFVIVWDMVTSDEITGAYSRDVFARRYSLATSEVIDTVTGLPNAVEIGVNGFAGPYRVNVETEYAQQNAAVAMDSDGDFVIVWESWEQDGSGWGIYGRRFDDQGDSFGRSNTIQRINFSGEYAVNGNYMDIVFIDLDGVRHTISKVPVYSITSDTAKSIEKALLNYQENGVYLFQNSETGEQYVTVAVLGAGSIGIEFSGPFERQTVDPLVVTLYDTATGSKSASLTVTVSTTSFGSQGTEFRVNDTTESHQRFASIGMNADGSFVVSWTAWGQDEDDPEESNVYMKSFVSNHSLRSTITVDDTTSVVPQVITSDTPANHEETDNSTYNGVGYISVGSGEWAGTGALLSSGIHVLTAAHVVTQDDGTTVDPTTVSVTFVNSDGEAFTYIAREIYAYTDYYGNVAEDTDLAIILLAAVDGVDNSINSYDIYRDSNEIGQSFTLVGFGDYDTGYNRTTTYTRPTGVKHSGMNTFDMLGTTISSAYNSNTMMFDFDNGTWTYDTFGRNYGVSHYGLGDSEALSAPGDSGGPCFIDGKIAGVISWGSSTFPLFGDYAAAVRVSAYTDWIDGILAGASGSEVLVNRGYEEGMQLWSDVEIDLNGHIAVTWTSYNQDEHGDTASGGTSNGLGGIYVRRYWNDPGTSNYQYSDVELVNDYTGYDQIHSKIDMDGVGNFVITWESYEDRTYSTDQPISIGVYAKRYLNTEEYYEYLVTEFGTEEDEETTTTTTDTTDTTDTTTTTTEEETDPNALSTGAFATIPSWMTGTFVNATYGNVYIQDGSIGSEFRVNELTSCDLKRDWLDDQRGVGVALDDNGDMVFVWTDMNNRSTPDDYDARVVYRVISMTEDDTPPFVTSVTAAYAKDPTNDYKNTSLMGETKQFDAAEGPEALVYTFNELMFTTEFVKQLFADAGLDGEAYLNSPHITTIYDSSDSTLRSLLNNQNWTLLKDGVPVTSSLISRIYYGYNAGSGNQALGGNFVNYTDGESNQYELVIEFTQPLDVGYYKLTLSDNVTDLGNNKLDGNYDGKAGASFTIDFLVGEEATPVVDSDVMPYESIDPEIAYFDDGTFIIVAQGIPTTDDEDSTNTTGTTDTTDDTDDDSDSDMGYDIIYRKFDTAGNQISQSVVSTANTYTLGDQLNPDVAGSGADNYAIVWNGEGRDGEAIYARFYVDGLTTTEEIRVSDLFISTTVTNKIVSDAQVVYLSDPEHSGMYLVTWRQRVDFNYVVMGKLYKVGTSSESNSVSVTSVGEQFVIAYHERYRNNKVIQTSQSIDAYHISYGGSADSGYYFGVAWEEYGTATASQDVYFNTFTYEDIMDSAGNQFSGNVLSNNYTDVRYNTIRNINSATLASTVTNERQCEPNCDIDENGNLYIVYTSDQNVMTTGADVYTRSFTRSGSGSNSVWTARGVETRVNTETDANVLTTKQFDASISASLMTDDEGNLVLDGSGNPVGGYVITWTSFNAEGYNYDLDERKNLSDYGIKACAYSLGATLADDKMLAYDTKTTAWTGLTTTNPDSAIFLVNDYTNGDQVNSAAAVGGWSRITTESNSVLVPQLVVAWDGVFRDYEDDTSDTTDTTTTDEGTDDETEENVNSTASQSTASGTVGTEAAPEYTKVPSVFYKWYMVGTKTLYSAQSNDYYDDPAYYSSNTTNNQAREAATASGSAGYFRPSGTAIDTALTVVSDESDSEGVAAITGTTGDDTFEFYMSSDGKSWTAKLNGVKIAVPATAVKINLIGLTGSDTLKFIGSGGAESVVIYGDSQQATIVGDAFELYALGFTDFQIGGGAGNDSITVNTSKGNDTVTMGLGELTLTSTSRFSVTADGFEEILAKSASGTDKAIILDSKQNDRLSVGSRSVQLTGGGYSNTATGFTSVQSTSSNTGDSAEMTDLASFTSSGRFVFARTAFVSVTTVGYADITATGTGTASASIIGSLGDDEFTGDSTSGVFLYSNGIEVNMSGFATINVNGNGGNDTATLLTGTGQNVFSGRDGSASLTNGTYTRNLTGFSHVTVNRGSASKSAVCRAVFYDSLGNDSIEADQNGATMSIDGSELYQVIAFDQIIANKEVYSGKDTVKTNETIDYLIENNGWDILK